MEAPSNRTLQSALPVTGTAKPAVLPKELARSTRKAGRSSLALLSWPKSKTTRSKPGWCPTRTSAREWSAACGRPPSGTGGQDAVGGGGGGGGGDGPGGAAGAAAGG